MRLADTDILILKEKNNVFTKNIYFEKNEEEKSEAGLALFLLIIDISIKPI